MKMATLLVEEKYPDLVNDFTITTGGAQPLHMCGMSKNKQYAVWYLVDHGMTPLHVWHQIILQAGLKCCWRLIEGPSHAPPAHGWSHVTKQMINVGGSMVRTFRKMAENNVEYGEQGEYMLLLQFRSDKVKHVHNP